MSKMFWGMVIAALFSVSVHAQHVGSEGDFIWEAVDGGVSITGFTGSGAAVQIPPQIQGQPVVSIGTAAFLQRGLAVVIIPDTVTNIGPMAFASNELVSMNIPPSVTVIGQLAFADNRLSSVIIPTGVTSIGYRAFHGNELLLVIIPDSVVAIGDDAFGDARLLRPDGTEVYIADFHPDAVPLQAGPVRRRNWFSTEFAFLGLGFRYDRNINDLFSFGGRIFVNTFVPYWFGFDDSDIIEGPGYRVVVDNWEYYSIGLLLTARFFPWGSPFYFELGMGWGLISRHRELRGEVFGGHFTYHRSGMEETYSHGLMIAPAIGARFGGRRWGFFVNPFVSMPVVVDGSTMKRTFVMGIGLGSAW